jgi:Zn-finger nucleic acid-binding protein
MPESAGTLNCPMCGAPTRTDAPNCEHCGARLATVACPSCFAMIFEGSTFCPHCGARADRKTGAGAGIDCPHCKVELATVAVGKALLSECSKCEGLWVDKISFEQICADREQQSAVLTNVQAHPIPNASLPVRYIKCPKCTEIMNRVNFAHSSGVIIDMCRPHGVWFDAEELQRLCEFIRQGGLDIARQKEIAELKDERRRTESARIHPATWTGTQAPSSDLSSGWDIDLGDVVWTAGRVLWHLMR